MPVVCGPFTTLESLDDVAVLDKLGFSLDDPIYQTTICYFIDDGGFVVGAQKCGPFTLEELNFFGNLDELAYSLDSEVWNDENVCAIQSTPQFFNADATVTSKSKAIFSGDGSVLAVGEVISNGTRLRTGDGSVSGSATVVANGNALFSGSGAVAAQTTVAASSIRIRTSTGFVDGIATVTCLSTAEYFGSAEINGTAFINVDGVRVRLGDASISGDATVAADGIRVRTSTGLISGTATAQALGGVIYSAVGRVTGTGSVAAYANAIFSGKGAISTLVNIVCKGTEVGEAWVAPPPPPPDDWEEETAPPTTWTDSTPPPDTWTEEPTVPENWTPEVVNPVLGDFYKGGYYAGSITYGGATYDLVVAPKAEEISRTRWEQNFVFFGNNDFDGVRNTDRMIQFNPNGLAKRVRDKLINGYNDWYIPAKEELIVVANGSNGFTKNLDQKLGRPSASLYFSSSNVPSYCVNRFYWQIWAVEYTTNNALFIFRPILEFSPCTPGSILFSCNTRPIRRIKR
jgi:hypothetical protein